MRISSMKAFVVCLAAAAAVAGGGAMAQVTRDMVEFGIKNGIRPYAEQAVATKQVPGLAIVVVYDGEMIYSEGFGLKEMGKEDPVDADTVFQLASMSKPVSSAVVAALVSKGLVGWDDRISQIAPDYQLDGAYPTAEVTLRDLFNHRSGLPGSAGNDLEDIGYKRDWVMHQLRLVPAWVSFRGGYSYSNMGLTMGGLAAATAAGLSWEEAADQYLFHPLGMKKASYRHADFVGRDDRAALHIFENGEWVAKAKRDADAQAPAGGASASVKDLAAWMILELNKGKLNGVPLIDEAALAATHEPLTSRGPNPVTGAPSFYGLGWNVEFSRHGLTWGHAGAFSQGARTLVILWPDEKLGITILANAFPTGVPEGIADNFADMTFDGHMTQDYIGPWNKAYAGLFGPAIEAAKAEFARPPAGATPALADAAYLGTYANEYVGQVQVVAGSAGLEVRLGPDGMTHYPLTHFDRDTFIYYASPEMPDFPSPATFRVGPDGSAQALVLDSLDANGLGTVTRQTK